ncbi:LysE/ArgO family amino acid transporter [Amycolatopsis roodepoortensis]|uniref:L-lysine exporter family protein LysE/ArgO n=1 Tax=Amycolatopsis roodepoortensis TaxID=700274 RepID=A0ABR9LMJ5_9PSEU|nr:LysE/ArgO family amino acid transporter [Amycolatopsis roodepoortensis]MBE1581685.1 L-lysine exporter family protein LysE/ArgO [Amycolatopsis roodepoortensis]
MGDVLFSAVAGFGATMALIVAIGAQNAFVLRQGIRREAVLVVVLICIFSDAILVSLGVGGVGALVGTSPEALTIVALVGGAFLLCYGALAARRAFKPSKLETGGPETGGSLRRIVLTTLAITWLNPHVYLDTLLLLGAIAAGHGSDRWAFGVGAVSASVIWFLALGFGARLLSGFFRKPSSWRVLDGLVAATMIGLGVALVAGA